MNHIYTNTKQNALSTSTFNRVLFLFLLFVPLFNPSRSSTLIESKLLQAMPINVKNASNERTMAVTPSASSCKNGESNGPKDWYKLNVTFQASPDAMLVGDPHMNPAWKLFLFGNGSPTQHLGLLTGSPTVVDVLGMLPVGNSLDDAPSDVEAIAAPRCRRQVWLSNSLGELLGYAVTWISVADVNAFFKDTKIPIGTNIRQHKTELYRDMKSVFCGHSTELEMAFNSSGPCWGRSYYFWKGGNPLMFIYEVFSPALEKYMGKVLVSESPTCLTH